MRAELPGYEQASDTRQRLQDARQARAEMKPVEISGMAAVIAMASGAGQEDIARSIGAVKAFLFLALIECLVWLSLPAIALLRQPTMRRAATEVKAEPVATVAKSKPATVSKGGKAYYLQRLERDFPELATRVHRGELSCYKASIMAGIRKAPTKDWSKPGAYGVKVRETA